MMTRFDAIRTSIGVAFMLIAGPLFAADAPTPKRGGTLRLAFEHEFSTLDPAVLVSSAYAAMQRFMFRGLFDYGDQNQLMLEQARDWSLSEDKKTYTFQLLPGVRFANGREVEAEDYLFSLERILNPKTGSDGHAYFLDILGAREFAQGKAAHVAGLRAPGKHTLVIELSQPSFVFRYKLALPFAFPVPREVVAVSERDFRQHLIGSGPYKLKEHKIGLSWRLDRNRYYTGPDGYPNDVDITIGGDMYLQTMMVERGELDFSELAPQDLLRLNQDAHQRELVRTLTLTEVDFITMNTELKPFDSVLVRRAVNHALNRERLAKLQRPCIPAHGIVPPHMAWNNPEFHPYSHDPEKARALLHKAGYPEGFETELWYPKGYLGRVPEAIQEDLRQAGIKIILRPTFAAALTDKVGTRREVPMCLWGWIVDFPDPTSFFDPPLNGTKISEKQCLNYPFYNNPEVNRLIVQADLTFDVAERKRMLQRMEVITMNDAPWAPVVHEARAYLCHPRLRGFQEHLVWMYRLEKLWLDE